MWSSVDPVGTELHYTEFQGHDSLVYPRMSRSGYSKYGIVPGNSRSGTAGTRNGYGYEKDQIQVQADPKLTR